MTPSQIISDVCIYVQSIQVCVKPVYVKDRVQSGVKCLPVRELEHALNRERRQLQQLYLRTQEFLEKTLTVLHFGRLKLTTAVFSISLFDLGRQIKHLVCLPFFSSWGLLFYRLHELLNWLLKVINFLLRLVQCSLCCAGRRALSRARSFFGLHTTTFHTFLLFFVTEVALRRQRIEVLSGKSLLFN